MPHDNKQLTRRWFDEVWNQRRRATIHEMIHADTVGHGLADAGQTMSVAGFIPFFERFTGAFPDIRIIVDDVIGEGDQTVCRLHAEGTHTGPQLDLPPTGRRVSFTALIMIRWRDGKILESWNEFDAWGLMRQLTGPLPLKVKV